MASRIAPIEEILGDTGMLVDNEPAAFAAALLRLIDDTVLRRNLGIQAAARARELDGTVMEERERSLYAGLLASV